MSQEKVFEVVKNNILEILPDLDPSVITTSVSLKDLGANSLDRADVATMSMEDLNISMPMMELAKVANIGDLVDVLHNKMTA